MTSQTINTVITASMYPKLLKCVLNVYLKSFHFFPVYAPVEHYVPKRPEDLTLAGSKVLLSYLMKK